VKVNRLNKIAQTKVCPRFYCAGMDPDLRNSLEAIANLIYLIRHSVHDQAATIAYADLADERVKAIALHFERQRVVAP
jgi:hypothetical protein